MGAQLDILHRGEGDAWYKRNREKMGDKDRVSDMIERCGIQPRHALEIGCSNGWRLQKLKDKYGCEANGIDISWDAIKAGREKHSKIGLRVGSADNLGYGNGVFDLVILGFFLYLADREDLFRIAAEADRVLADRGYIIIEDFFSTRAYAKPYHHADGMHLYKMDYGRLFTWNPAYRVIDKQITGSQSSMPTSRDDQEAIIVLRKTMKWPLMEAAS